MKFKSEKDVFVEALATAGRSVGRTSGATQGILLTLTGNQLTVTGTDLDITARVNLDVIGHEDGAVVVPARLIVDAVRLLDAGAVTVEAKDEKVEVKLGKANYNLRTYGVVDFPKLPPVPAPTATLAALDFVEGLNQVVRASSNDDARPLLTGVLFTTEGGVLRMVATDSYRLAVRDLTSTQKMPAEHDLLIPSRALAELQRAASSLPIDAAIGVSMTESEITFIAGATSISTRLIDGNYPDYRPLIPPSYPNQLRVGKDTFLSSLKRMKVLAKDPTSSVRLTMHDRNIDITTQSADQGVVADNIDADYQGEELTIAFNPTYLMDGVEAINGDEVVLEITDGTRAAMLHGVDDTQFRYLLMPVRVQ
jgi:DNA polymerase-3 subunit beta